METKVKRPRVTIAYKARPLVSVVPEDSKESYKDSRRYRKEDVEQSHHKNVSFFKGFLEEHPTDPNKKLSNAEIASRYEEVKVCGEWVSIRKFLSGLAMMMYELNYQFR